MKPTKHFLSRISQRGIPRSLIERVLDFGDCGNDEKITLDRKVANKILAELDKLRTQILKILDKGGITVVVDGATLITAYNVDSFKRGG